MLDTDADISKGDVEFNQYKTVNGFYNTSTACVSYWYSSTNYSAQPFDFEYIFPNETAVNATSEYYSYTPQITSYCNSRTVNETTGGIPKDIEELEFATSTQALYYWQDPFLNDTWWAHFNTSPLTSDYYDWISWGFYPTDPTNFRCVSESGVYQASSPSIILNQK